ncbi:sensor histidine kinase [Mucisphaera calidilacus]|uniref:histidine kinase n=1 Tax=Mucisphaera calidilacus TaxID=2527982 RepID=A0A518BTB9_9BACT|nr:HAMP domain-containing sensor histidine kinase [Mucisphaera calidilacus]QDU70221.1 Sensor protein ZraS [Mucisphaera calidilacus]
MTANELLTLPGHDASRPTPSPDPTPSLAQAVEQVLRDLQPRAATLDAELIIELALNAAQAEPGPLPAILGHLVENSLDAVARAARGPWDETPHQVLVTVDRQAERIILAVTDTGDGLDPSILDTHGRVIIGRSTKPGRTGLGLRLVRDTVEQHDGHLSIDNVPNAGVHAEIDLPVNTGRNARAA